MTCCATCGISEPFAKYEHCHDDAKENGVSLAVYGIKDGVHIWIDRPEPGKFYGMPLTEDRPRGII